MGKKSGINASPDKSLTEEQRKRVENWSALLNSFPWRLLGATKLQALRYQENYEAAYGLIDFITDMIYFHSVLDVKISDNHSGDAMKAFLFISSIFGIFVSSFAWLTNQSSDSDGREEEINGREERISVQLGITYAAYVVFFRTVLEDTPQVIITLVIDHYRIQQGEIERLSNFGALNIAVSLFSMLQNNWKLARQTYDDSICIENSMHFFYDVLRYFFPCKQVYTYSYVLACFLQFFYAGLLNFIPCIITVCVLYA